MDVQPYLSFDGNCREAFEFYAATLGGTIEMVMTYGESPMADDCGAALQDRVMHLSMRLGTQRLMGADSPPERFEKTTGVSLSLNPATLAEGERLFAALAAGGRVTMPLQPTFWTAGFGMAVDRFGVPWMVNVEQAP